MIDLDNDPILNASSINSEDYWFLKVSGVDDKCAGEKGGKCAETVQGDCAEQNAPAKDNG